ncbi:uncharacterized protein with FMN-binding domain [Phycicoccus badiiscoriae]|uniref:Uncharacterized protein with FMN-binding domain n=1 Tax=Pedococcus badiiscoriae TaxID=642776 RepID=A0A852WK48_9MICO|nr:FMN-binding protein [Pedococcus badiiscoriae]NYG05866.1 uncharacterized protein with FMN-binding domain [Pedococcus badiiscoriae]
MRRITLWALSTLTTLVLLFSYHTSTAGSGTTLGAGTSVRAPAAGGTSSGGPTSTGSGASGSTSGSASGATSGSTSGSTSVTKSSGSTAAAKTYTGDTVQTRWGPVQVQITVKNGKITASQAVVYPSGNGRDEEINSVALPILSQEVVQHQSANIDMVSGATVTSDGYLSSLQSAIDKAHL